MSVPVWTTTAGKIASIDEVVAYSLQLEANTADSTAITYSVIAGSLPSGMELTSTGLLTGTPAEVSKRTLYTFVVRATAGSNITDRTFTLDVKGEDAPTFTTNAGRLNTPITGHYRTDDTTATADTTKTTADTTGNVVLLDGSYISYQLGATDTDTQTGQKLMFEVVSGSLPPGTTMTNTGKISGIVELTEDERFGPIGGYAWSDGKIGYDDVVFDRTVFSISRSVNYDFVIRVTDGVSYVDRNFSIFVYSADFFRVDSVEISVDADSLDGYPLLMSGLPTRKPVFKTDADLGTFRHDNSMVISIDVWDFDALQGDLEYELLAGTLPTGLKLSKVSGELYGRVGRQAAIETTYTFQIRAKRVIRTGVQVSTAEADDRVLNYSVTTGSLPPGITLSSNGNLIGIIDKDDFVDSTRAYTFTISVSDQYQSAATEKEFTINVDIPYTSIEYGNMVAHSTSLIDQNVFYNIAQDPNINSPENIYRPEDTNFGMKLNPEMLMLAGLQAQTLTTFQQQMEQNHAPKTLYFGDLKTAVAKENNVIKYEVVYLEMTDKLVNNNGTAISSSVSLRTDVAKPMLGPRAGTVNLTTDMDDFNITTSSGLSFSTAGSKARYTGNITADLDYMATLYPNAVANMRSRMKTLGHKEWDHLPLWMKTTQPDGLAPLGFVLAVPICYCKPGTSALLKKRIIDKGLIFRNIDFIIDRYQINQSKVTPATFTADGTTTAFVLDEIVHQQDILVKKGSVVVYAGDNVTADNSSTPTYLTADGELRSADHEFEIALTHNTSTKKTTVTFVNAPDDGTIIKVARGTDKYLKFRNKGIF